MATSIDVQTINGALKNIDQLITLVSHANTALGPLQSERDALRTVLKVDAQGAASADDWQKLPDDQKTDLFNRVVKLREALQAALDPTGPGDPGSIMYAAHASNRTVILVAVLAFLGSAGVLWAIFQQWPSATSGKVCPPTPTATAIATPTALVTAAHPMGGAPPSATPTALVTAAAHPTGEASSSATPTASATAPATPTSSAAPIPPAPTPQPTPCQCGCPAEADVLLMIILMGAMGGLIHVITSLTKYVGNRQFLRSWVLYYVLMPAEGAMLAPILYLLLRVGVLSPGQMSGGGTCAMNVLGLYAFAGMTGLFSKQAIEMLADVFNTIFKRVQGKDQQSNTKSQ